MKQVAVRVRQLREERMITQKQLGEAIGVRQSTISEIEKGNNNPSIEVLCQIAAFFDVRPGFFLDDEPIAPVAEIPR